MNETIIRKWNERVKPEDIVYHVGDFCFKNSSNKKGEGVKVQAKEWEDKLNGKIIHIRGNHDKNNTTKTNLVYAELSFGGKQIAMFHNPENVHKYLQNKHYIDFCFTGHMHEKWKFKRVKMGYSFVDLINVGVDVNSFMPKTYHEIISQYKYWKRHKIGDESNNV
jgi:calcineurin-like phosphoesterase family protein